MSNPVQETQLNGSELQDGSGKIEARKRFGPGGNLPPGAVAVEERVQAKYVTPGTTTVPHGVPPIGVIGLPTGWVLTELYADDGTDTIEVLPFRFPWYSRAYGLRSGEQLCAVLRNIQPFELSHGQQVVVQYNESHDWIAVFGKIAKLNLMSFKLEQLDGEQTEITHDEIQFVGKVMCWWDEKLNLDH